MGSVPDLPSSHHYYLKSKSLSLSTSQRHQYLNPQRAQQQPHLPQYQPQQRSNLSQVTSPIQTSVTRKSHKAKSNPYSTKRKSDESNITSSTNTSATVVNHCYNEDIFLNGNVNMNPMHQKLSINLDNQKANDFLSDYYGIDDAVSTDTSNYNMSSTFMFPRPPARSIMVHSGDGSSHGSRKSSISLSRSQKGYESPVGLGLQLGQNTTTNNKNNNNDDRFTMQSSLFEKSDLHQNYSYPKNIEFFGSNMNPDHARNFSIESFSIHSSSILNYPMMPDSPNWIEQYSDSLNNNIFQMPLAQNYSSNNDNQVFKVFSSLLNSLLGYIQKSNELRTEFCDEFSYNIVVSHLLNDKILVSNYYDSVVQESGPNLMDGKMRHSSGKFSKQKLPIKSWEKILIVQGATQCEIKLFNNSSLKVYVCVIQLLKFKNKLLALNKKGHSGNPTSVISDKNLLISLVLCELVNLRKLMINRLIYFFNVQSKAMKFLRSKFIETNKKFDVLLKKLLFNFKEFDIYHQIPHSDAIPDFSKSKVLRIMNNPSIGTKTINHIIENLNFVGGYLILKSANFIVKWIKSKNMQMISTLERILFNYLKIHNLSIEKLYKIILAHHIYAHADHDNCDIGISSGLKPLQLTMKSSTIGTDGTVVDLCEAPFISSLSDHHPNYQDSEKSQSKNIEASNSNQSFSNDLKQFEVSIDNFHLIRKFYLIIILVIVNEAGFENDGDVFNCEDEGADYMASANILNILRRIGKCESRNDDLILDLYDEFDYHGEFFSRLYGVTEDYLQYNGLGGFIKNEQLREMNSNSNHQKYSGSLFGSKQQDPTGSTLSFQGNTVFKKLSHNLNKVSFKLSRFENRNASSEPKASIDQDMLKTFGAIERDLSNVLSSYQASLRDFKASVVTSQSCSRTKTNISRKRMSLPENRLKSLAAIQSPRVGSSNIIGRSQHISKNHQSRQSSLSSIVSPSINEEHIIVSPSVIQPPSMSNYKRLSTGLQFSLLKISEYGEAFDGDNNNSKVVSYDDNYLNIYKNSNLGVANDDISYNDVLGHLNGSDDANGKHEFGDLNGEKTGDESDEEKKFTKKDLEDELTRRFEVMIKSHKANNNNEEHSLSQKDDEVKKVDLQTNDNSKINGFMDRRSFLSELQNSLSKNNQNNVESVFEGGEE
ncbi:hypothetical protein DASC09_023560 [Saccharomycopsis crataegensis]|uniref:Myosin-binding domain-containing protein n=1 Tax=Saccharomycopsis crataegensis TaxID=43959 RepID=A0AAV5QK28_9ASCO|nr:hypothetical protein DASC09_023560 [Saccharomycopsis crataegensis]